MEDNAEALTYLGLWPICRCLSAGAFLTREERAVAAFGRISAMFLEEKLLRLAVIGGHGGELGGDTESMVVDRVGVIGP